MSRADYLQGAQSRAGCNESHIGTNGFYISSRGASSADGRIHPADKKPEIMQPDQLYEANKTQKR